MYTYAILIPLIVVFVFTFLFTKFKLLLDRDVLMHKVMKYASAFILVFLFIVTFLEPSVMMSNNTDASTFTGGCINLIGTPYGDNTAANFFAWFQLLLYYPCALGLIVLILFDFDEGKFLLYFILTPLLLINAGCFFNLANATNGNNNLSTNNVLLTIEVALVTSLAISECIRKYDGFKFNIKKNVFYSISLFILLVILFAPSWSLATLCNTHMIFDGKDICTLHAYNFSLLHRISIYLTILFFIIVGTLFRFSNKEQQKYILLSLTIAGFYSFIVSHSAKDSLLNGAISPVGPVYFDVRTLPFDIKEISFIVLALYILTDKKIFFNIVLYVTLPIVTFSFFFPRYLSYLHVFNYVGRSYWQESSLIFIGLILLLSTKEYNFPRLKDSKYVIPIFAGYFLVITVLNSWLTNYVPGYNFLYTNLNGCSFLNTNRNFLYFMGDWTNSLFKASFTININGFKLVYYPVFQFLLLVGYIALFYFAHLLNEELYTVGRSHALKLKKFKVHTPKNYRNRNYYNPLSIIKLNKKYKNNPRYSLRDINLSIKEGDIVGLLGHNGAGKTTLIKCIVGQEEITNGEIYSYGIPSDNEKEFKRNVGYIPDHYILHEEMTGREYVNYIADLYKVDKLTRNKRILKYLKLFNLKSSFDAKIKTYSFGMKQKITILSTLVFAPKIWLLDEPLTGLDSESIFQTKACILEHAKQGNIVIFSSHLIDLVEDIANRVIILKKGELIYDKTMKEALKECGGQLENLYMEKVRETL